MALEGYIEYQRREFCKDLPCPIQVLLDAVPVGSKEYEHIRSICVNNCIHTTYEFHHWLIQKGYLLVRPMQPTEGAKS
ncbi:MAG: hypothetical protein M1140_07410 [Chloroflexi bacterium]|nr:hypothetical protein [Chloroflexota bacterium]